MQKNKFNLGGEQSGHIILGKFTASEEMVYLLALSLYLPLEGKKEVVNFLKI